MRQAKALPGASAAPSRCREEAPIPAESISRDTMTITSLLRRLDRACHIPLFEEIAHELDDIHQLERGAAAACRGETAEGGEAAAGASWSSVSGCVRVDEADQPCFY